VPVHREVRHPRRLLVLQYVRQQVQQVHGGSLVTAKLRNMLEGLGMLEPEDWNKTHMPKDKWLRQLIMARAMELQAYASGEHQAISVDHTFSCT
jgi:hypothetical protein